MLSRLRRSFRPLRLLRHPRRPPISADRAGPLRCLPTLPIATRTRGRSSTTSLPCTDAESRGAVRPSRSRPTARWRSSRSASANSHSPSTGRRLLRRPLHRVIRVRRPTTRRTARRAPRANPSTKICPTRTSKCPVPLLVRMSAALMLGCSQDQARHQQTRRPEHRRRRHAGRNQGDSERPPHHPARGKRSGASAFMRSPSVS